MTTAAAAAGRASSALQPIVDATWPKEVQDEYEPIRELGKGGFASVILAKNNTQKTFHAMKLVGPTAGVNSSQQRQAADNNDNNAQQQPQQWKLYAYREIDILKELSHPNIIQVHNVWENSNKNILISLQYVKGPTLQSLILHRGALDPNQFGRIVIAQLVDAIYHLHSHAVIHRDIKPDNVIVTGALSSQDCIWDGNNKSTISSQGGQNNNDIDDDVDWDMLRKKWHVTIIDFGFARALTPNDVNQPSMQIRRENLDASYSVRNLDGLLDNTSRHSSNYGSDIDTSRYSNKNKSSTRGGGGGSLNRSFSRVMHRQMSALGNRQYAAPEILQVEHVLNPNNNNHNKTHPTPKTSNGGVGDGSTTTGVSPVALTDTISHYVSEYGLLVDAYSLGHTIRYMMTGVPPHESVEEKIAYKNSIIYKIGKLLCPKTKSSKGKNQPKIIRLESELPGEVQRLIEKLTERLEKNRTSVRQARKYPWIDDVLPPSESAGKNKISYLPFVMTTK